MSRGSQRKGRAGELELVKILKEYGYEVKPGISQSYGEEPDISGLPGVHIECKRCEQLRMTEWMKQASRDAERFNDGVPAVFHRKSREPWLVTMQLNSFMKIYGGSLFEEHYQERN